MLDVTLLSITLDRPSELYSRKIFTLGVVNAGELKLFFKYIKLIKKPLGVMLTIKLWCF